MGISDEDWLEIKRRLQADNVKIQFGVGDAAAAADYIGAAGEPIYVEDREAFAVCDGKTSQDRIYYPVNKGVPKTEETIDGYLKHLIDTCLDNTYPSFLTNAFAQEGYPLTRSKLVEAFEGTKKFCVPDGRSLPADCYVRTRFGISSAPNLVGRFMRHYDPYGSADTPRGIGSHQSDAFQDHYHGFREDSDALDFSGWLVDGFSELRRSGDWSSGYLRFVYNMTLTQRISRYSFPDDTGQAASGNYANETRPKNLTYISFYRYDW
ncbi:hypothetical protein [Borrelia sp. RT5S]|uniref:hypothetical protein n=1 Tax=Borrelia sp. RT5S TaxID=2898581 RepID=UPI001E379658|nr:hypothetical protein [Borrelia sp. RT5S]UGQ16710.1 hypothetical protein LSO06_05165 [Borrelia sp. RT5S]